LFSYSGSAAVVFGQLGVVLWPNIVYSAFLLGGGFSVVAGLYLMLNRQFRCCCPGGWSTSARSRA